MFVELYTYECMLIADSTLPNARLLHFGSAETVFYFHFCQVEYFDNFGVAFWDAGSCCADTGRDSNALNHPSYIASQSVPLHFPSEKGVFFMKKCILFLHTFRSSFTVCVLKNPLTNPFSHSASAQVLITLVLQFIAETR